MGLLQSSCRRLDIVNGVYISNMNNSRVTRILMPVYYIEENPTPIEVERARVSWERVTTSESSSFLKHQKQGLVAFPFFSCEDWFQFLFYERLFDVHPDYSKYLSISSEFVYRTLFKAPRKQGIFLTALFSFIFSTFEDPKRLRDRLVELAESHCKKGVKACEYGVIGEVMFWTLSQVLGREYSSDIHTAWMKIFSTMLRVIVPISINYELQSNAAQIKRLADFEENCVVKLKKLKVPPRAPTPKPRKGKIAANAIADSWKLV